MMSTAFVINDDCCAFISLFKRQPSDHDFARFVFWANEEDNLLGDYERYKTFEEKYDFMAKRLIDAFEDEYCVAFLEALIRQAKLKIEEHWKEVEEWKINGKHTSEV